MRSPYRHSVWIDVFGVLLAGSVLLGGAAYLLSHAGGAASSLGGGGAVASGGHTAAPGPPARRTRRSARGAERSRRPLFGGSASTGERSGAEVPFSEGWQEEATPDLTGPGGAGSSAAPSGGGSALGGGTPEPEGPTIASRRSPTGGESGAGRTSIRPEHSSWRAEAQNLSGRARALSNQLGQMERRQEGRAAPEQQAESSPEDPDARTSASEGSASANSDPGTPDDPSQVPIGGLEWLAAVGLLYGLRRLGFTDEP